MMQVAKIRAFMEETFLFSFGNGVDDDTNLFQAGIMDSFGYVRLIGFLRSEFGAEYSDEDMLTDILVSFNKIRDSLQAKLGQSV
ncbi:acyl carrier protein [Humidesulfovibrio idahonensis]